MVTQTDLARMIGNQYEGRFAIEVAEVAKELALADLSLGEFLTTKYALWLKLRTTDDERPHVTATSLAAR